MAKLFLPFLLLMQLFAAQGVLIPFYHYPSLFDKEVEQLVAYRRKYPSVTMLVIINPDNGFVTKEERNFAFAIDRLKSAGIKNIGYIHTSYGSRKFDEVVKNLERWKKYYGKWGIDGIFVDEMNCSKPKYYKKLFYEIKKRFRLVVANPGVRCEKVPVLCDVLVSHENSLYPDSNQSQGYKKAAIVHSVSDLNLTALKGFDFIYVTDQNGSNPYERLSKYLPQILERIEARFQKGLNKNAVKLQVQSHE